VTVADRWFVIILRRLLRNRSVELLFGMVRSWRGIAASLQCWR
jgi:hypothetical protein